MKIKTQAAAAVVIGLFALGPAAMAQAQGSSAGTSGPAAGGNVKPQTGQNASGVAGPTGSKNGPSAKTGPGSSAAAGDNMKPSTGGTAGNAAGVSGPAGSKSGPAQRSGTPR
jgi:hypothetical protein